MSTAFFRLKKPITHIRVGGSIVHIRLSIWVNHTLAGILTVRNEELKDILFLLIEDEECLKVCVGSYGRIIYHDSAIPDEAVIISEYGEVTTISAMRESVSFSAACRDDEAADWRDHKETVALPRAIQ